MPYAGELRVVDLLINNEASYANVGKLTHSNIFNSLQGHIASADLENASRQQVATILGSTHTFLSYTHPFRFNNDLTKRIFIDHILDKTIYNIDFMLISRGLIDKLSNHDLIDAWNRNKSTQEIAIRPGKMGELYWNLLTPKNTTEANTYPDPTQDADPFTHTFSEADATSWPPSTRPSPPWSIERFKTTA